MFTVLHARLHDVLQRYHRPWFAALRLWRSHRMTLQCRIAGSPVGLPRHPVFQHSLMVCFLTAPCLLVPASHTITRSSHYLPCSGSYRLTPHHTAPYLALHPAFTDLRPPTNSLQPPRGLIRGWGSVPDIANSKRAYCTSLSRVLHACDLTCTLVLHMHAHSQIQMHHVTFDGPTLTPILASVFDCLCCHPILTQCESISERPKS